MLDLADVVLEPAQGADLALVERLLAAADAGGGRQEVEEAAEGFAGAGSGAGVSTAQWSSGRPSSGLQSTIISISRRAAIIDGKTVELWAKHGNARLIEVNEGSVVLQGAEPLG